MDPSPDASLDTFLDTVEPAFHAVVRATHEAILKCVCDPGGELPRG